MILKSLKNNYQTKKSLLTGKKISDKEYEHVLNVSNKFEIENDERLSQFVFKM